MAEQTLLYCPDFTQGLGFPQPVGHILNKLFEHRLAATSCLNEDRHCREEYWRGQRQVT
jgi:hypothetical protein